MTLLTANNLASLLERSARRFPAFAAIAVGASTVRTYAELAMRVARLAAAMHAGGLARGDRVALVAARDELEEEIGSLADRLDQTSDRKGTRWPGYYPGAVSRSRPPKPDMRVATHSAFHRRPRFS